MVAELLIFGGQALAGVLLVTMAAINKREEKERGRGGAEKQGGTEVAIGLLSDAWKKAKGRGVSGHDRSLGFCALSECIARLRRGEDIDAGVAATALALLGLAIVDDDGEAVVVEI